MKVDIQTVFVISLARRRQRLLDFIARWRALNTGIVPYIWPATDHHNGAYGCYDSHRRLWEAGGEGPILILEDDAIFHEDFTLTLDAPDDWEILWLGGQHHTLPIPVDDYWARPTVMYRTHAYVVRKPIFVARSMLKEPAIDPFLARKPFPQYVQRLHTVGQAAGYSDRTGRRVTTDQFWHIPEAR